MTQDVEKLLPAFLAAQRWFGEKTTPIASVSIEDLRTTGGIQHLIVVARFVDGHASRYYVPISMDDDGALVDAAHHPEFHHWLSALTLDDAIAPFQHGRLIWNRGGISSNVRARIEGPSRVLAVEQSNTSIRFGDAALVKILRRLQPGVNPEIELTRFLTERTDFRNAPALLGTLTYVSGSGEEIALAVAQSFVPSISDGWTAVLSNLVELQRTPESARPDLSARSFRLIHQLGHRTAEFHLALSSALAPAELAPEAIAQADADQWTSGFKELLDRVSASLQNHRTANSIDEDLRQAFLASATRLLDRVTGFDRLVGVAKTRVHGDYHLGQVLLTNADDWVLLDFEGEPRRTLNERRAKTSPLKDVAGMLRSFSYARGTAERVGDAIGTLDLIAWERGARAAFLAGYLTTARAGKAGFLPGSDEDFRLALEAWELDKAIYEIDYELNNRPDWLWLPLSAALKFI